MKTQKARHFSESFKREKVKLIENKQVTVLQLSRIYEVSTKAIYKWIRKYSTKISKVERIVIEKESEGYKAIQLMKNIGELERKIGQQQLEIDYLEKILEFGTQEAGFDIKKKYLQRHWDGSGTIENQ
jgi:transposase-like protein